MNYYIWLDYYKNFKCKTGSCRSACCKGWNVSVTLDEYFKVINLDCDNNFREKLDRGFYINLKPTSEHYAIIRKDYNGDCVFHGCDGLCEIHKMFGEKAIPSVCNFYPRNISKELALEKSCSNSCEKVLELLFENTDLVKIEYEETSDTCINPSEEYTKTRKQIIDILQTRDLDFKDRIKLISSKFCPIEFTENKVSKEILIDYLKLYKESVVSREIIEKIEAIDKNTIEKLEKEIYKKIPNFDMYLEKYLVNHVFFTGYPYDKLNGKYNYMIHSLIGVYELTKYVSYLLMKDKNTTEDLVDIIAFLYRLIGHSDFHKMIGKYLYANVGNDILGLL